MRFGDERLVGSYCGEEMGREGGGEPPPSRFSNLKRPVGRYEITTEEESKQIHMEIDKTCSSRVLGQWTH